MTASEPGDELRHAPAGDRPEAPPPPADGHEVPAGPLSGEEPLLIIGGRWAGQHRAAGAWEPPPPVAAPPIPAAAPGPPAAYPGDRFEGDEPLYGRPGAYPGEEESLDLVEPTRMRARHPRGRTVARELIETLLLALLVFLAVRASFQNFKVDGNSMYPTLDDGEFLIVNKLIYSEIDVDRLSRFLPFLDAGDSPKRFVFHGPERGDIVVLRDPRQPEVDLIKRVIGLPGETVEIVNGVVFVNGYLLEEPYIDRIWHYTGPRVLLGPGEYFVMGDNRDNSKDSRSVGPVARELIIGKAMLTYWPVGDFGLAPNRSPSLTGKTIEAYRAENGIAAASSR